MLDIAMVGGELLSQIVRPCDWAIAFRKDVPAHCISTGLLLHSLLFPFSVACNPTFMHAYRYAHETTQKAKVGTKQIANSPSMPFLQYCGQLETSHPWTRSSSFLFPFTTAFKATFPTDLSIAPMQVCLHGNFRAALFSFALTQGRLGALKLSTVNSLIFDLLGSALSFFEDQSPLLTQS